MCDDLFRVVVLNRRKFLAYDVRKGKKENVSQNVVDIQLEICDFRFTILKSSSPLSGGIFVHGKGRCHG